MKKPICLRSAHAPIIVQYSANLSIRNDKPRIPISQSRVNQDIIKAEREIPKKPDELKTRLENIKTGTEFEGWYIVFKQTILEYLKDARTSTRPSKMKHSNNTVRLLRKARPSRIGKQCELTI